MTRRGEKGQVLSDAVVWILPAAIIGARLWYVINATLGGSSYYLDNPIQIINIPHRNVIVDQVPGPVEEP